MSVTLVALVVLLPALSVAAEDLASTSEDASRSIHLKSGKVLEGRVIELTGDAVVFEFDGVPGSRGSVAQDSIVSADLFDLIMESRGPKTAEAWLSLAKVAAGLGLKSDRVWCLRNAAQLAPERAREIEAWIETSRQECAQELLNRAKEYLEGGDLERARRTLALVMSEYCGCDSEAEGSALMKEILGDIDRIEAKAAVVVAGRRKIQDGYEDLQAVRELMERGEDALRLARGLLSRPGAALTRFEEAQSLLERGWKILHRFAIPESLSAASQEAVQAEIRRLREALRDDRVAVHLEMGHAYLTRSDFGRAAAQAGEAAALDPENLGVRALRIAIAAAHSTGRR